MKIKGVVFATAVAAAMLVGGCSQQQPMPQEPVASQTGPSTKLGTCCRSMHCKCHHRRSHHCKSNHCHSYNQNQ